MLVHSSSAPITKQLEFLWSRFNVFDSNLLSSAAAPRPDPAACPGPTHPPASCTHPRSHCRSGPWSPPGSSSSWCRSLLCFPHKLKPLLFLRLWCRRGDKFPDFFFSHACPCPPVLTHVWPWCHRWTSGRAISTGWSHDAFIPKTPPTQTPTHPQTAAGDLRSIEQSLL